MGPSVSCDQLLLSLPHELRDHVVGYAQLKMVIDHWQAVSGFSSLGFGHSALEAEVIYMTLCLEGDRSVSPGGQSGSCKLTTRTDDPSHTTPRQLKPKLGLSLRCPPNAEVPSDSHGTYHVELHVPEHSLRDVVQPPRDLLPVPSAKGQPDDAKNPVPSSNFIIPLPTDAAFFQLLTPESSCLSRHFDNLMRNFDSTVVRLAESITLTAIPSSSSARRSFSAYSLAAGNASILDPKPGGKSDLPVWREIFRLYSEAEIFESAGEASRGDRTVQDMDTRLESFTRLAGEKKSSLVLAGSREAFEAFLKLNTFILDVKKVELSTSEAIRKILREHANDTALSIPTFLLMQDDPTDFSLDFESIPRLAKPLSRLFIQAISKILLPVVPQLDDYICLICTAIAFKPVRLRCRHFFCVRCLVKLQKRGRADCPMCRAPTVLQASAANVDYALLNFMADWFPIESREKQRANDREATRELMEEYRNARKRQRRVDGCWIM